MPLDQALPAFDLRADFWSLRFVEERSESYAVRKNVAMPLVASTGAGHEQGQAQKGAALLGIGNAQEVLRERRPDG